MIMCIAHSEDLIILSVSQIALVFRWAVYVVCSHRGKIKGDGRVVEGGGWCKINVRTFTGDFPFNFQRALSSRFTSNIW
jgi:hypothetical protein